MTTETLKSVYPETLGWVEKKLDTKEMEYLWRIINKQKESAKQHLAGQINQSNYLVDKSGWFFTNTLTPLISYYEEHHGTRTRKHFLSHKHPLFLAKMWVNYQRENEFQPLHDHYGVYSFVVWMKIPFDFEKQNTNPVSSTSNNKCISAFEFYFLNMLGERDSYRYGLNAVDEGTLLFFPSELAHCVYPFYNCKEERISISGNIGFNTAKQL